MPSAQREQLPVIPFGGVLGTTGCAVGCVAFSNGNEDHFSHEASEAFDLRPATLQHALLAAPAAGFHHSKELMESVRVVGVRWQCVEFVRRYLLMSKAVWLRSVPSAEGIWGLKDILHLPSGGPVQMHRLENGKTCETPKAGDLVVWRRTRDIPFGHVAVVVAVDMLAQPALENESPSSSHPSRRLAVVSIAEQNFVASAWKGGCSRSLDLLLHANGSLELLDDMQHPIIGWLHVDAPHVDFQSHDIPDAFRLPTTLGSIRRISALRDPTLPWLKPHSSPCDFFLKRSLVINGNLGEGAVAAEKDTPDGCYVMDGDMWSHIRRASHTLHDVAMAATWRVVNHADAGALLEHYFGIPAELHEMVRHSLHKLPPMLGRFDFGFDGEKLKMLEYNCDSSAALYECCDTQDKWAHHMGPPFTVGTSTGSFLYQKMKDYFSLLAANHELCPASKLIHFMVDDDDEERYTALCVAHCAQECGFRFKMCVKLTDFRFAPRATSGEATTSGECGDSPTTCPQSACWRRFLDHVDVVDLEGERVVLVWKTWSWDTVLHQYRLQRAEASCSSGGGPPAAPRHPTLSDILLNQRIHTFEPLWKMVTGSKALLPYMHDVDPHHEHMVYACFRRSDRMLRGSYLSKPVNGRAGQNITMFDPVTDAQQRAAMVREDEDVHHRLMLSVATSSGSPVHTPTSAKTPAGASFAGNAGEALVVDNETSDGRFFDSLVVYQRRVQLKKFSDQYFPIFCGWMVGDAFGGVVVREDTSKITKLGSIVAPCRVVRGAAQYQLESPPGES